MLCFAPIVYSWDPEWPNCFQESGTLPRTSKGKENIR